jgi:large subunit ribosomal protein L25
MAERIELDIASRDVTGKATKRLRKAGIIPANISGHKEESRAVQIDAHTFELMRKRHGTSHIISLRMPGAAVESVLIKRVQHDPTTGKIVHVDFSRMSLSERTIVKIRLQFVGDSPAVKNDNGTLLHVDSLEVECQAGDIVNNLQVDISSLTDFETSIAARDVKLPEKYTLVTNPDETIVRVAAPRTEAAEVTTAAPEGVAASISGEANKAAGEEKA